MKKTTTTLIVTLVAALSIVAAVGYNAQKMQQNSSKKQIKNEHQAPQVSVVDVSPNDYQAHISGYGEALPLYMLELKAEVSGRVTQLQANFASGKQLSSGQTLAQIDQLDYQTALASAKTALATARQTLLEEQRQQQQAQMEWQQSGLSGKPDSPLVLREPQLRVAQTNFEQAQQQVTSAQRDLQRTAISAPFDALIVSRNVDLGDYVKIGDSIATLYSTNKVEVSIPLSDDKWRNIQQKDLNQGEKISATLTSIDGSMQWQGYIDRIEQHLNQNTRQCSLVIAVDNPLKATTPLYPNTYVKANIQGKKLSSLLRLPQTAISQNGDLWTVDSKNQLQKHKPVKVFEDSRYVYIKPLPAQNHLSAQNKNIYVVARPLNNYMQGSLVDPITVSVESPMLALNNQNSEN